MNKRLCFGAVAALGVSYCAMWVVSYILSITVSGGVLASLVPYAGGMLAAIAVTQVSERYLPRKVCEETVSEYSREDGEYSSRAVYAVAAVAAAVLAALNFLYGAVAGGEAPNGDCLPLRVICGVIIKPAAEEYLFRVSYLRMLTDAGMYPVAAVLIQAVLFALLHTGIGIPFALFAGAVLGWIALKAEKCSSAHVFASTYICHALYNGILYISLALALA